MKKILAVDDQKDNLITLKAVLKSNLDHCELITATSGKEGLKLAEKEQPDVILLDIIMPGMDGFEVCKKLKSNPKTSFIPIILITAIKTDTDSRVKGLELGADAFLSKPIDPAELSSQVKVMLRIKAAEDELRQEKADLEDLVNERTTDLKSSEEKYRSLYDNAPLSYQSLNQDGFFLDVNPTWLDTLGYKRDEVIGKAYKDFLHPEWKTLFEKRFPAFKKNGYVHGVHFKIRHKKGHYLDISFEGCIGYNPDGTVRQTYCVFQDITEKLKAENDLRESMEKYESLYTSANDAIFLVKDNTFLNCNPKTLEMFNCKEEDIIGKTPVYFSPDYQANGLTSVELTKEKMDKALSGEPQFFEWIHKRLDGTIFNAEISLNKIEIANEDYIQAIVRDVTERKKAIDELHDHEALLETLIQTLPDLVWMKDKDGVYLACNKRFEDFFGTDKENILGKNDYDFFDKELAEFFRGKDKEAVKAGKPNMNEEEITFANDGHKEILETIKTPIFDSEKQLVGVLGIGRDITQRKKAEELQVSHLEFLQTMDSINNIIMNSGSVDLMMDNILQEVLTVFKSDRAWLLYPCDPDAEYWGVPMEKTREGYDGAFAEGNEMPINDEVKTAFNLALSSNEPIVFDPESPHDLPPESSEYFSIKSQMILALKPRLGKNWLFGIHQCSHERVWNEQEKVLFKEIGRRINEGLNSLISLGDLEKSEEKFRTILENSVTVIYNLNLKTGTYDYLSPSVEKVYGYSAEDFIKGGVKQSISRFHPDDVKRIENHLDKLILKKLEDFTPTVEYRFKHPKLGYRWMSDSRTVVFDKDGEAIALVGSAYDMTERKLAEENLELSEMHYKALFENSPVPMWEEDCSEVKKYINRLRKRGVKNFEDYFKRKPELIPELSSLVKINRVNNPVLDLHNAKSVEELYKGLSSIFTKRSLQSFEYELLELIKGETKVNLEGEVKTLDGILKFIDINLVIPAGYEDTWQKVYLSTVDITKKKQAENALKSLSAKFSTLYGNEFFESVCAHLCESLKIDYAFVGELINNGRDVTAKAGIAYGKPLEAFSYNLAGTPCEKVIGQSACSYPNNVQKEFPEDHLLVEMGIESYVGVPLYSKDKTPSGIMVLLHSKEIVDDDFAISLLQIFSERVAAEIERSNSEKELLKSEERYRTLMENLPVGVFRSTYEGNVLSANIAMAKIYGYDSVEELLELPAQDYYAIDNAREYMLSELEKHGALLGFETLENKKDGSKIWVSANYKANFDSKGRVDTIDGVIIDITERKMNEDQIRKQSTAIEQSPAVVVITDIEGKVEYVNPKFTELTGYSFEEVLGQPSNVLKSGEQSKEFYIELWDKINNGKEWRGEFHNKRKNGELFWESASISAIFDEDNKITNYIKIAEDITEKKKAEELLIERQEFLNTLLDATPIPVFYKDIEGKYLGVNKSFADFFGKPAGFFIGKTVYDIAEKEFADEYNEKDLELFQNQEVQIYDYKVKNASGEIRKVIFTKAVFRDLNGKVIGLIGAILDITDRIKVEEALRESEERFKALHNASFGGIAIHDMGHIIDCNQGLAEITGYDFEDLIGMDGLRLIHKDYIDLVLSNIKSKNEEAYEAVGVRRNGETYPLRLQGKAVPYKGKEVRVVEFRDISKQKQIEEELRDTLYKATESDRLKSAFLATMSHELRTPLNAIIGFSDIISDELPIEDIIKFNKNVNNSGKHLLSIVEDLFDITMIESGEVRIDKQDVNLSGMLSEVHEIIRSEQFKVNKEDLELLLSIPTEYKELMVKTDDLRLKQILINLLKNALKFTIKGSITYGFTIEKYKKESYLQFFVKDTGIGIAKEKRKFIFDVFRQVEDSHTREFGGTGIGLSISKKLTSLLGGEIWLESEVAKGTTFYFTIPIEDEVDGVEIEADAKKPESKLLSSSSSILIVEDDESSYEFIHTILEKENYSSMWAKNGEQAVEKCAENEISLILMDINMPILNGFEATKIIKNKWPEIPVIAQTAYAIVGDKEKAMAAGCDDYISKPIKRTVLIKKIQSFLSKNEQE